jgi:AcrR family transcriptional regulator
VIFTMVRSYTLSCHCQDRMSSEPDPQKSYHHGDLRRALLDAALEAIEADGLDGLSLRGIARRAGVSHAAPYHHFRDREALVAAVAEEGFGVLRTAMLDRMAQAEGPRRRLQQAGVGYVLFALDHPAHFQVMFGPELADRSQHASLEEAADAAFAVVQDAIAECRAAGLLIARDPRLLALTAWSVVHGLAMLKLGGHLPEEGEGADDQAVATALTDVLWEGLGQKPGDPDGPHGEPR